MLNYVETRSIDEEKNCGVDRKKTCIPLFGLHVGEIAGCKDIGRK